MTDTWRRAIGALFLIASMGTSTCATWLDWRAPATDRIEQSERGR